MNGNFASTPLTNTTIINSSPVYGHYPGPEPISPLEARFISRNIGAAPRPQQIGQETGPSYSPQYLPSRSEIENQFALQQAQAECSRLKQQLVLLETQKLEQQNVEKFNSTGTKRKRQPNTIRHYAQGFTFSTNFWTVEKAAVIVATTIPPDFDPQTRFTLKLTTPTQARQHALHCFLWELNEYLPEEAKHFMKNVPEMAKFLSYSQTLRSELQGHVRDNVAVLLAEFENVTKEDCAAATDPSARATNLLFRELLGYNVIPTITQPQYPSLCPIISRDDDEFPFGTENIIKFLAIILFGKSQARAEIPERHKGCNADNWCITEVTANMIAVAATMLRYLVSPDRTFTALGTTSKIDWIATCLGYKTLIVTNKETPGIISLFERLNSRLFGGTAALVQQPSLPSTEGVVPAPFDASMQSAMASLQLRRVVSPIQDSTRNPESTSTPSIGINTEFESRSPAPAAIELPTLSEDQAAAAYTEDLIRSALDADSNVSSDEDDSSDNEKDNLESTTASGAQPKPVTRSRPTNLNLLATIASTAQPPLAPPLPTLPLSTANNAISTTGRASKRKADQPDYADLDENGEPDTPEQKRRKVVKKRANNGAKAAKKGANSGKGASGGSGSNPPATARARRNPNPRTK